MITRCTTARTHRRDQGFTLIELLIVVVIIGILAVIAVPKFEATRGRASKGAVVADLRNLAMFQEGHFLETRAYSGDLDSLKFVATSGVTVTIHEHTGTGWSASGVHSGARGKCAIYHGNAAAVEPARVAGSIRCE